jgi:ferric-dicitrate binding protein FerR (iron transport regulator)
MTVSLADGSSAMLNADSRLQVAASYGDERRSLRLDGEAYFEVEPGSPFVVETETARVRVVGTSFGVRSYEQEETLSVVVAEGTVGVDPEGDATPERTLGRKQRAVVSSAGEMNITSNVALDAYLGWREGRLVFNSTPLPEVIDDLERQYGLRIALLDSELADRRLTTTFENQSFEDVLDVIALSLDIGYRRTDSTVVFGRSDRPDFQSPSAPGSRQQ